MIPLGDPPNDAGGDFRTVPVEVLVCCECVPNT